MKAYFESADRQAALDAAAKGWSGTPFRHNSGVRGEGANCVLAIAGVLEEAGFAVPTFELAPTDWARHQAESKMEIWMDSQGEIFERLMLAVPAAVRPGDVVGFRVGLCVHHLGVILTGGRWFQCNESLGASILSCAEREFSKRLARAWRPVVAD